MNVVEKIPSVAPVGDPVREGTSDPERWARAFGDANFFAISWLNRVPGASARFRERIINFPHKVAYEEKPSGLSFQLYDDKGKPSGDPLSSENIESEIRAGNITPRALGYITIMNKVLIEELRELGSNVTDGKISMDDFNAEADYLVPTLDRFNSVLEAASDPGMQTMGTRNRDSILSIRRQIIGGGLGENESEARSKATRQVAELLEKATRGEWSKDDDKLIASLEGEEKGILAKIFSRIKWQSMMAHKMQIAVVSGSPELAPEEIKPLVREMMRHPGGIRGMLDEKSNFPRDLTAFKGRILKDGDREAVVLTEGEKRLTAGELLDKAEKIRVVATNDKVTVMAVSLPDLGYKDLGDTATIVVGEKTKPKIVDGYAKGRLMDVGVIPADKLRRTASAYTWGVAYALWDPRKRRGGIVIYNNDGAEIKSSDEYSTVSADYRVKPPKNLSFLVMNGEVEKSLIFDGKEFREEGIWPVRKGKR